MNKCNDFLAKKYFSLNWLASADLSVGDIVANTHIPRATVGRKLAILVRDGVLKKIGAGKKTRYSMVS